MTLPDASAHYFPQDVYRLRQDEVLIDCGAFDGDTIRAFIGLRGDRFTRIVGFEPDDLNWHKLRQTVEGLPEPIRRRIQCFPYALGASRGSMKFEFTGTELSKAGHGQSVVTVVALDDALEDETPTIIKFDIEGGELDALAGARQTINRHLPVLAVSTYHRQSDLWNIALSVSGTSSDYRHFLRPHGFEGWDLVSYAVPAGRSIEGR
jgi:FkbM family methyltransferase